MTAKKAEMEQQRLLRKQQEEEERIRNEKLRQESERQFVMTQKTEMTYQKDESSHMEEMKRQHEQKLLERQRLEMMISQESKVAKGQVAKRSDDVHGLGWGNVTTGFVSRKKLGFLQHAASVERTGPRREEALGRSRVVG